MKKALFTAVIIGFSTVLTIAQAPPPPPADASNGSVISGGTKGPVGGSAPISDGTPLLLGMALVLLGYKTYKTYKMRITTE